MECVYQGIFFLVDIVLHLILTCEMLPFPSVFLARCEQWTLMMWTPLSESHIVWG